MENIFRLLMSWGFPLILRVAAIVYLTKTEINRFLKNLLNTSLMIGILTSLFFICYPLFLFRALYSGGGRDSFAMRLTDIVSLLGTFSLFLLLFGLCLLCGSRRPVASQRADSPSIVSKRKSLLLMLLLQFVTLGIYNIVWLYRTIRQLRSEFKIDVPYTPGQAIGFLFIPVFNLYWGIRLVLSLPRQIQRIEKNYVCQKPHFHLHPLLISLMWFLLVPLTVILNLQTPIGKNLLIWFSASLFLSLIGVVLFLTMQAWINGFLEQPPAKN